MTDLSALSDTQVVTDLISSIKIQTPVGEVDAEVLKFYEDRFKMFVEDNCQEAIGCYLKKANKEDINDTTKFHIMYAATQAMSR